jgi:hypothetical protein
VTLLSLTEGMAAGDEERRQCVIDVWSFVLTAPRVDLFLHRVLRRWAKAAEGEQEIRDACVRLFVDVARAGPRQDKLVLHHARNWRGKEPAAPDSATRLLTILGWKD